MSDCIIPRAGDGCVEIFVRIGEQERVFELSLERVLYWARFMINSLEIRVGE
jgi:hypothetical protein